MLDEEGPPVDLATEPCAANPRIAVLAAGYQWKRGGNHRYTIYWGENGLGQTALVVTAKGDSDDAERVIAIRGKGFAQARQPQDAAPTLTEEKDPNAWMQEFQDWLRRMRRQGRGRG